MADRYSTWCREVDTGHTADGNLDRLDNQDGQPFRVDNQDRELDRNDNQNSNLDRGAKELEWQHTRATRR